MHRIQELAAGLIARVEEGRTLTEALAAAQRSTELSAGERGALQDIGYGTLRHLGQLRFILRELVPKRLPSDDIERLLLVALYQLAHTRAAPYAVVDQAVRCAEDIAMGRLKGLVNGTLRNFLRNKDNLLADAGRDNEARYNHPRWWVQRLRAAYPTQWASVLEMSNRRPPMTLRVNAGKLSAEDYVAQLAAKDIKARIIKGQAVQLDAPCNVRDLPGFAEGVVSVQDFGAQKAALLLDVADGMRVLDACAAPGGKTGHLLELAQVKLLALDVDAERLQRVEDNLQRLGLSATLKAADAAKPETWWDGQPFDRILADVPCSASGVVRRHPDIKWLRRPDDFAALGKQQAAMVDALWPTLAAGGKLLYATCSIMPEENRQQVDAFLKRHGDAKLLKDEQLLPTSEHDGFYYALLVKKV
ncbi:16S rRNA (cytosine(967)-C(5))-methyltransferase RsmB [Vogesella sp. DC21W]|uniref:16S rRNA (cytosine(967)-C(5))-methyltransferase n=1 Tax=Vogesella aquatica TaxID=2984206 RepID=A0ABT5J134_9NEIS|nr:16S rRNA (cytosine(967)-C(5))-methyltransferase RsmB [Vogesella aquatica]MDC7718191.1 16S rRNA (cytosine(967)-C(5))-methyltransferase RsmB [Vogesella aquatica]